jgi:hypothetical protein
MECQILPPDKSGSNNAMGWAIKLMKELPFS